MSAEEDGDFFGAVVEVEFGEFFDEAFGRFERFRFGSGGSPPDEDDDAADEDGDGGGEEHDEFTILEEDGGGGVGGRDVGRVELASDHGGHEIEWRNLHGA